jgi:hypothetical protein
VNASTLSLAVFTFDDPQNGHFVGITGPSPSSMPAETLFTFGVPRRPAVDAPSSPAPGCAGGAAASASGPFEIWRDRLFVDDEKRSRRSIAVTCDRGAES